MIYLLRPPIKGLKNDHSTLSSSHDAYIKISCPKHCICNGTRHMHRNTVYNLFEMSQLNSYLLLQLLFVNKFVTGEGVFRYDLTCKETMFFADLRAIHVLKTDLRQHPGKSKISTLKPNFFESEKTYIPNVPLQKNRYENLFSPKATKLSRISRNRRY